MNFALLLTAAGPALGVGGWFTNLMWPFWLGTALCVLTLLLNMASGVMKLPVLPALFMAIAAALVSPWHVGLAVGLIAWTALESIGEVVGLRKEGRL